MAYYTYLLSWTDDLDNPMFYIGSRYSKRITSVGNDTRYRGSVGKNKEERKAWRELTKDAVKKVLRVFDSKEECLAHEIELHEYYDVKSSPLFYNKSNQTSTGFSFQPSQTECYQIRKVNIYSYDTQDLISEAVIMSAWCKENNVLSSKLCQTARRDRKRTKNFYARYVDDEDQSRQEPYVTPKGLDDPKTIAIDIFDADTGEIIAERVSARQWCEDKDYFHGPLLAIAKGAYETNSYKGLTARLHMEGQNNEKQTDKRRST